MDNFTARATSTSNRPAPGRQLSAAGRCAALVTCGEGTIKVKDKTFQKVTAASGRRPRAEVGAGLAAQPGWVGKVGTHGVFSRSQGKLGWDFSHPIPTDLERTVQTRSSGTCQPSPPQSPQGRQRETRALLSLPRRAAHLHLSSPPAGMTPLLSGARHVTMASALLPSGRRQKNPRGPLGPPQLVLHLLAMPCETTRHDPPLLHAFISGFYPSSASSSLPVLDRPRSWHSCGFNSPITAQEQSMPSTRGFTAALLHLQSTNKAKTAPAAGGTLQAVKVMGGTRRVLSLAGAAARRAFSRMRSCSAEDPSGDEPGLPAPR